MLNLRKPSIFISLDRSKTLLFGLFFALSLRGIFSADIQNNYDFSASSPINISNVLQAVTLVFIFIVGVLSARSFGFIRYAFKGALAYYSLYVVISIVGTIFSYSPGYSIAKLFFLVLEYSVLLLVMYYSFYYISPKHKVVAIKTNWQFLINLVSFFLFIVVIASVFEPAYQKGYHILVTNRFAGGEWFYWGPNILSELSAIICAVMFFRLLNDKMSLKVIAISCLSLYILLKTNSRTSIFALLLCIPFILYLSKRSYKKMASLILILVLFFVAILLSTFIAEYVMRGQTVDQLSEGTGRLDLYEVAIDHFLKNNIYFGSGFYVGTRQIIPSIIGNDVYSNLDNTHLEVLVNTGIFSYIPFFIFIALIWQGSIKHLSMGSPLNTEMFISLIVISIRSLTGPTFHIYGFELIFLVFFSFNIYLRNYKFTS